GTAANDLVLYDVRAAESAAQRIESARQRGNRTAWQLDALCALLATIAAFATVRAVRQMHRVQQANHDLTQRKAAELEQFADCAVACSPGVLLSLLGNLLRNGLKYLGNAEVREVSLRVRPRRGRVLFEVEDTGPGIPPALGQRIFEPYFRGPNTGAPGIGLGL